MNFILQEAGTLPQGPSQEAEEKGIVLEAPPPVVVPAPEPEVVSEIDEDELEEPPPVMLLATTKSFMGWRTSWCDDKNVQDDVEKLEKECRRSLKLKEKFFFAKVGKVLPKGKRHSKSGTKPVETFRVKMKKEREKQFKWFCARDRTNQQAKLSEFIVVLQS